MKINSLRRERRAVKEVLGELVSKGVYHVDSAYVGAFNLGDLEIDEVSLRRQIRSSDRGATNQAVTDRQMILNYLRNHPEIVDRSAKNLCNSRISCRKYNLATGGYIPCDFQGVLCHGDKYMGLKPRLAENPNAVWQLVIDREIPPSWVDNLDVQGALYRIRNKSSS